MVDSTRLDVVCLHETKKVVISHWMVMSTLRADFDEFTFLPPVGTCGFILMIWKGCVCKVLAMTVDDAFSFLLQFD
jgi:hypothetical protein